MPTNVYHYRSTIINLQCEGTRRVLYDDFLLKIIHGKKNDYIPQEYLRNFCVTTVFPTLSCYCLIYGLIVRHRAFAKCILK